MAFQKSGKIYQIFPTESKMTSQGNPFYTRRVVIQSIENGFENFITFEFKNDHCAVLDQYQPGQPVCIDFDISGRKYVSRKTGQEEFWTSLTAFRISLAAAQPVTTPQPAQQYQPQPMQYRQAPQNSPQSPKSVNDLWQQAAQVNVRQNSPQTASQPSSNPQDELPF